MTTRTLPFSPAIRTMRERKQPDNHKRRPILIVPGFEQPHFNFVRSLQTVCELCELRDGYDIQINLEIDS
jgi:hypothetical protein